MSKINIPSDNNRQESGKKDYSIKLPAGEYLCRIEKSSVADTAQYLNIRFKVIEGNYNGQFFFIGIPLRSDKAWILKELLCALGLNASGATFDTDDMNNRTIFVQIGPSKYSNKMVVRKYATAPERTDNNSVTKQRNVDTKQANADNKKPIETQVNIEEEGPAVDI